jgi:hypothetical protein
MISQGFGSVNEPDGSLIPLGSRRDLVANSLKSHRFWLSLRPPKHGPLVPRLKDRQDICRLTWPEDCALCSSDGVTARCCA